MKTKLEKYEIALQRIEFNLRHGGCGACCEGCNADMKLASELARKVIGKAKTWKEIKKTIKP